MGISMAIGAEKWKMGFTGRSYEEPETRARVSTIGQTFLDCSELLSNVVFEAGSGGALDFLFSVHKSHPLDDLGPHLSKIDF